MDGFEGYDEISITNMDSTCENEKAALVQIAVLLLGALVSSCWCSPRDKKILELKKENMTLKNLIVRRMEQKFKNGFECDLSDAE